VTDEPPLPAVRRMPFTSRGACSTPRARATQLLLALGLGACTGARAAPEPAPAPVPVAPAESVQAPASETAPPSEAPPPEERGEAQTAPPQEEAPEAAPAAEPGTEADTEAGKEAGEAQPESAPAAEAPGQQEGTPPAEPGAGPEAAAEVETSAAAAPQAEPVAPRVVSGSLAVGYRGRSTGDDQDHDLRAVLALDVLDPRVPWLSGHLLVRGEADLDGHDDQVFADLSSTWDSSLTAKLYLAYAEIDLEELGHGSGRLQIGRQSNPRLPEVLRLDGLSYTSAPLGARALELGLYAGIPVHLYESSSDGDQAFGTFLEGRPWKGGQARLDYMHLEDEQLLGKENNDLLSLWLWQRLARSWQVEGELDHLEGDPRNARLRLLYEDPETETIARLAYHELLTEQTVRVDELDPFTEQLLEYFPFRQATLDLSRGFGRHLLAEVGWDARRMSDEDDVGEFNREWERYRAAVTWRDAGLEGLDLTLDGDRWNDDGRDVSAFGADVSLTRDAWRGGLGTYYALYKYDFLELDENEDVRTYYVNGSRQLSERLRLDGSYEFEDDDLETYHTLRLGVRWQF